MVTSLSLSFYFRMTFSSNRFHGSQTLLQPALQHFYPNFPLIKDKLGWKLSNLVISEILRLFGNTLTTDHMYFRHRWEKFLQQLQSLFSQKRIIFSKIFILFLESTQKFLHIEKKGQLHSFNIFEVIYPEKCGYFNAHKLLF